MLLSFMFAAALDGKALVVGGSYQLVLTARKKLHEIAEKFARLLQAFEMLEVEFADVAAEQDAVVDVLEGLEVGIRGLQNFFEAEFVKGAEPEIFGAVADRFDDAILHFTGGFVGE